MLPIREMLVPEFQTQTLTDMTNDLSSPGTVDIILPNETWVGAGTQSRNTGQITDNTTNKTQTFMGCDEHNQSCSFVTDQSATCTLEICSRVEFNEQNITTSNFFDEKCEGNKSSIEHLTNSLELIVHECCNYDGGLNSISLITLSQKNIPRNNPT